MYTPDLLLAMIIAVTMRTNKMVTIKVILEQAIATGTTMLFVPIGTWVADIEQKNRYIYVIITTSKLEIKQLKFFYLTYHIQLHTCSRIYT